MYNRRPSLTRMWLFLRKKNWQCDVIHRPETQFEIFVRILVFHFEWNCTQKHNEWPGIFAFVHHAHTRSHEYTAASNTVQYVQIANIYTFDIIEDESERAAPRSVCISYYGADVNERVILLN